MHCRPAGGETVRSGPRILSTGTCTDSVKTYATVMTCIMVMALNPEKLRIAQEEIDRVVGVDRLPTVNDRARLPYVNAIIKETMRWHPALPLGKSERL